MKRAHVIPYLLQRGLISREAVVDGHLSVAEVSRRNRNYLVCKDQGPSYLLKQAFGSEGAASIRNEAATYARLQPSRLRTGPSTCMPTLYDFDDEAGVLVIEAWPEARNLRDYHRRLGRFPVGIAAQLGRALGELHQLPPATQEQGARQPEALLLHRPTWHLCHNSSRASVELLSLVQSAPAAASLLDQAWGEWQSSALIHGDLKSDNLLVVRVPANGRSSLKLIDWELAGAGDPCWDVGSVFGDYLTLWLLSVPLTGELPPEALIAMARYPLDRIQPALCGFWAAYTSHMAPVGETPSVRLLRAVRYGAARLLQTAFEYSQVATEVTAHAICLAQVALNMLQRPDAAAEHLLGISRSEVRPV